MRVRARASACACNERVRLRVCSWVCLCSFGCVRGAFLLACPCVYACLCERMCVFVRFHRIAIPRVCVASVCVNVCVASVCARRGAVRALPSHGGDLRY